jgi:hypothetical protein
MFGVDGYVCCVMCSIAGDRVAVRVGIFIKVVVCKCYDVRCMWEEC